MGGTMAALRRHGPAVFGVALLVGAVYGVQKEFRHLSVADIREAMTALPVSALWIAAGLTVIAYLVLTIYDKLGATHGGVAAAELRHRRCTGCSLELNSADLRAFAAAPADEVLRCEECGRILVRGPESGL